MTSITRLICIWIIIKVFKISPSWEGYNAAKVVLCDTSHYIICWTWFFSTSLNMAEVFSSGIYEPIVLLKTHSIYMTGMIRLLRSWGFRCAALNFLNAFWPLMISVAAFGLDSLILLQKSRQNWAACGGNTCLKVN